MKNNKLLSLVLAGCMIGSTSLNTFAISNYNANKKIVEHKMVNMAKEADEFNPAEDPNYVQVPNMERPELEEGKTYKAYFKMYNVSTLTTDKNGDYYAHLSMGDLVLKIGRAHI